MKPRSTYRSRLRLAAVAALLLPGALAASPALAHDALSSTTPAQDAVVTAAPETVSVTLTQPPTDSASLNLSVITVTDSAGTTVSDGKVVVDGPTLATKTVPGSPGTYTVLWRAVSSDGHPIEGKYTFTVQAPASAATSEPAVSATPSAEAGTPSAAAQSTATAIPAAPRPNDDNAPLTVGIALGLLAAALGVTWWVRRRNANRGA
ncbi:copper resistance protein CopC [Pseudarthrobacter sp. H3Y2-7]|uniref:copper resistance CopC family protein n=1 Tax=Pseudarthrobacter naphthalenicus TaxID=3031328 RepID=UPI0023AF9B32|nr:copper resistance CopC family protein [Pseudarthrobacter sp. H3Y2-7]MDE8669991.1 copper resistance protein CopC [Pseudarthrobacter sp. H3Y2-7]